MAKSKKNAEAEANAAKHAEIRKRLLEIRRNHPNEVADNKFMPHIPGHVILEAIWLSDQLLAQTGEEDEDGEDDTAG